MTQDTIFISTDRFVYYDEFGEITLISNSNDEPGSYITVSLDKIVNFLTGKESTASYLVVYDTLIKKHVLKLKHHADEKYFSVTEDIFKIKKLSDQIPDLTVTRDIKNKKWIFKIDNGLKSYLQSQKSTYNKKIHFSVTQNNDPHVLYRLIIVDFNDLVDNDTIELNFIYQSEELINDLCVYTTKRFETYSYEVIND
jgi:hypothetical protein